MFIERITRHRQRLAMPGATYADLEARSAALAAAACGSRPSLDGAAVALLAPPGQAFVEALLGIFRAGGCAVPISAQAPGPEIEHQIRVSSPEVLLATRDLASRFEAQSSRRRILTLDERFPPQPFSAPLPHPSAPALMLFTSGTTGKPKGVVLTHSAITASVTSLDEAWRWRHDDRLLHVLPLHHTHGLVVALLGALWAGASVQFARFDAARVWDHFGDCSVFMAVPTMYAKLLDAYRASDGATRERWSTHARNLRLATSGSAPLPATAHAQFEHATGQVILERYGMTEIGMALGNPYDGPRTPGSVGLPLPGVEVDIVKDDGSSVAPEEPGEIRVRSPQIFKEYAGDPAATLAAFDELGRFRTGDTALRGTDGYVRILGRTSTDILKSGGYKLSALEIEQVLSEHEAIAEVAVIGVADATWGDLVTACVVLEPGHSLALDDLRAWCANRLSPYRIPRALRVMNSLPRSAIGKVMKGELSR